MVVQTIYVGFWTEQIILPILYFTFSLLTLFVLVYYVRRRYSLYGEIKRIPLELLYKESYRNHLKNLKLRCVIHNFIILVLAMELVQSIGYVVFYLPGLLIALRPHTAWLYIIKGKIQFYIFEFLDPILSSIVPVLSLMMNLLWLAYRKLEYKSTIIRWAWYIVMRAFVIFTTYIIRGYIYNDRNEYLILSELVAGVSLIFDFLQYVYYSRRFYLHLKSRETEIRLFYFNNRAYLDIKFIRFHFKIATILVALALFFYTVDRSVILFLEAFESASSLFNFSFDISIDVLSYCVRAIICCPCRILLLAIMTFNYLYMFIVVVYKAHRDNHKLRNINKYIKPIVKQYHDSLYSNYKRTCE